jgi:ribonuclease P protein subunit POP4
MASAEPNLVKGILARAHSPESVNRVYSEKIQYRPILLRPSSPPPAKDAREARRRAREKKKTECLKKLKPKPLSARDRRRLGLYDVPQQGQKYALFEPLHRLWLGYIREVLGSSIYTGGPDAAAKLSSADFHGAEVEVSRSGCVDRVGLKGIVVKDSRFVFEIVTRKNRLKIVPKEGTMFRVEIPAVQGQGQNKEGQPDDHGGQQEEAGQRMMVIEIHGDLFRNRAADRANKKFKQHFLDKL